MHIDECPYCKTTKLYAGTVSVDTPIGMQWYDTLRCDECRLTLKVIPKEWMHEPKTQR